MSKAYRDHARLIAFKKRQAETRGDRHAAVFLLEEFVNHADVFERANVPVSDRLTIRFVVRAVREILDGKNPKAALCLDSEGRPSKPFSRDLRLATLMFDAYTRLRGRAIAADGRPLDWAADEACTIYNKARDKRDRVSRRTVQEAWKRFGSRKGVQGIISALNGD